MATRAWGSALHGRLRCQTWLPVIVMRLTIMNDEVMNPLH
jgi:hypothetical protein